MSSSPVGSRGTRIRNRPTQRNIGSAIPLLPTLQRCNFFATVCNVAKFVVGHVDNPVSIWINEDR